MTTSYNIEDIKFMVQVCGIVFMTGVIIGISTGLWLARWALMKPSHPKEAKSIENRDMGIQCMRNLVVKEEELVTIIPKAKKRSVLTQSQVTYKYHYQKPEFKPLAFGDHGAWHEYRKE